MPKKYNLFSVENNGTVLNMEVDKAVYQHFQTLNPLQKKAIQDMMTINLLENEKFKKEISNLII